MMMVSPSIDSRAMRGWLAMYLFELESISVN